VGPLLVINIYPAVIDKHCTISTPSPLTLHALRKLQTAGDEFFLARKPSQADSE
jgi:hypothetical protein